MKADERFAGQPLEFWAHVRALSQAVGYTDRRSGQVFVPSQQEVLAALRGMRCDTNHLLRGRRATAFGRRLLGYFAYRADVLNTVVQHSLMRVDEARQVFLQLRDELQPECPIPMNKQKGEKRAPLYFTGIVNMLIEQAVRRLPCDYDPRSLTILTRDGRPYRTLARRIDGAFPSAINPLAVWEIKEYYYTTTFGSRVADGVYETLLDGMELLEARRASAHPVLHYLMVDDHFTWWQCGRSYLCRIVDMLHMGHVDEVLVGREVLSRLPVVAAEWADTLQADAMPIPPAEPAPPVE